MNQFNRAARLVDERLGHWPWWLKFLAFAPVIVAFTALLIGGLHLFGLGLLAIRGAVLHN